jgi:catechol 2,3-dioxygenase-like lactoylglutathione lyase family enzyme
MRGYDIGGRGQVLGMRPQRITVVLDAADLAANSSFWAAMLGGTVEEDDDWHAIHVDGEPRLAIQLAPDHVPPDWPAGLPQQIHLDLHVDDIRTAHDEAMGLGATLLKSADMNDAEGFQVYADPAGHPFCLCW